MVALIFSPTIPVFLSALFENSWRILELHVLQSQAGIPGYRQIVIYYKDKQIDRQLVYLDIDRQLVIKIDRQIVIKLDRQLVYLAVDIDRQLVYLDIARQLVIKLDRQIVIKIDGQLVIKIDSQINIYKDSLLDRQ